MAASVDPVASPGVEEFDVAQWLAVRTIEPGLVAGASQGGCAGVDECVVVATQLDQIAR